MMATTRGQESVIGLMGPPKPQETPTLPVPQFWTSGYQNYENFLLFWATWFVMALRKNTNTIASDNHLTRVYKHLGYLAQPSKLELRVQILS